MWVRLFAAAWPTPEVRDSIESTVQLMRDQSDAAEWRWVRPENWHVTVAFYGRVAEEQVPELTARLARAGARRDPFNLELGQPGRFGNRVVWLGLQGDREALRRLADGAVAAGRRTGVAMEERKFHPHLTLARSRTGADAELLQVPVPKVPWPVRSLHLVRSATGNKVQYDSLAEFPLGGD